MDAPALENAAANGAGRMNRRIPLLSVLAVALLLAAGCSDTKKKKIEEAPPIPEQALEKFSITETEGGKPHWVLEASSAQIHEAEKRVLLQLPRVKFYQKGEYVSTLVAEQGRINTDTYDIWGEGKCTVTTARGESLDTSNLHYRSDVQKIVTDDKVKLTRPDETVYGQGMEATPDLQSIVIRNQRTEVRR
jgi:LPS export ABC transporter protein LptC